MDGEAGARLARVAVVLAAVAVVLVVATTAVAAQRFAGRDTAAPSGPASTAPPASGSVVLPSVTVPTPTAFPGGRVVFGFADRDAVFEVPAGWANPVNGFRGLEVPNDYRGLLPKAVDTTAYGEGWCPAEETQERAYVGWGPPPNEAGLDAEAGNTEVIRPWRVGFNYKVDRRYFFPTRTSPQREITLDDGTPAWLTTLTGAIRDDDCPTVTAAEVSVVSFRNADRVTSLVGYRDIGTGDDLSHADLVRILRTLRRFDQ